MMADQLWYTCDYHAILYTTNVRCAGCGTLCLSLRDGYHTEEEVVAMLPGLGWAVTVEDDGVAFWCPRPKCRR